MSKKTGVAFRKIAAPAVATKVFAVVISLSFASRLAAK